MEVLEDLLRQLFVVEQVPLRVGHDELVGGVAVADRVAAPLVVFYQPDDLELERLTVVGLENDDVFEFERRVAARGSCGAVVGFDDSYSRLSEVALDVRFVLLIRFGEGVVAVAFVDVVEIRRRLGRERRVERRFSGIGDRRRRKSGVAIGVVR